jgi:hypothetical protein
MKKLSVVLLFFIILSNLFSQQLELEKIDDFMIAQFYLHRDNVIAEAGYLYTLSAYGLEIYEIGINGELSPQSKLPITLCGSIAQKDEYVYICSGYIPSNFQWGKLYQVNIEDKQNPFIEQVLNLEYYSWPIAIYGDMINVIMYDGATQSYFNQFYTLPNLNLIVQHQNLLCHIHKINDNIALRPDGYNQFTVFDLSDPVNPEIIGSGDVSAVHYYNISRAITYNDTILICSVASLVSFWDVSDWNNWEYISQYPLQYGLSASFKPLIIDSLMVLAESEHVELVDLTDITEPVQIYLLSGTAGPYSIIYIDNYNDNIYCTTIHNGIQRLKLINNTLSFENEYAEFYMSNTVKYNNFLISPVFDYNIKYYDYTNPTEPIDLGEFITECYPIIVLSNDQMAAFQEGISDCYIYDIFSINAPILTNQIELDYYHFCSFDQTDENSVYLVELGINHFKKYDISQSGTNELLFEVPLPFNIYRWIIYNDYGYFLENVSIFNVRLYIYEGLDTNQPTLCNTIDNFITNPYARLEIVDGMLVAYTGFITNDLPESTTKFFDITVPDQPALAYSLNAFGEPFIKNDLIFTTSYYECYVFEKPEIPTGTLEPFYSFYDVSNINNIYFIEYNNVDYLLLCEGSHTAVYSYDYTPSAADDEISVPAFTLTNYPNPFNPETKIAFNIPESGKVKVEIFNVKGQKVRTLIDNKFMEKGNHSIVWNGTDDNNQPVSTGIYFYQLESDGKPIASRKMMLLK